jgi:hypothetical protein
VAPELPTCAIDTRIADIDQRLDAEVCHSWRHCPIAGAMTGSSEPGLILTPPKDNEQTNLDLDDGLSLSF